jgi:hypothetical protein
VLIDCNKRYGLIAEKSLFYCSNAKFLEDILKKVPELSEPYVPTRFWGFSGHIQTIVQVPKDLFLAFAVAVSPPKRTDCQTITLPFMISSVIVPSVS